MKKEKYVFMAIYLFLNLTWGIVTTILGYLVAFALLVTGHKPKHFGPMLWFEAGGRDWGGFSIGLVMVTDRAPTQHIVRHEFGHSIQNALFGPFMLFVVSIPSMIRYWYYTLSEKRKPNRWLTFDYDAVWFEGTATRCGTKVSEYLEFKYEED